MSHFEFRSLATRASCTKVIVRNGMKACNVVSAWALDMVIEEDHGDSSKKSVKRHAGSKLSSLAINFSVCSSSVDILFLRI